MTPEELQAKLELDHLETRRKEAIGWLVVTVDDEFNMVVHATGPFDSPEQALVESGRRDTEDARWVDPEAPEPGWTHSVAPLFPPSIPRPEGGPYLMTVSPAFRPQRSVLEIVRATRAIRCWVDDEIARGRTDDEIVAMAPTAIAFINGDLSLSELEQRVEEARRS